MNAPANWTKAMRFDTEMVYAPSGLLLSRRFPATDLMLSYDYQPDGSLQTITLHDPNGRIVKNGSSIPLLSYGASDANGKPSSVSYGNGVHVDYAFDPASGAMRHMGANSGATGLADLSYGFTDEGFISTVRDGLKQGGLDLSAGYRYDIAHRLVSATGPYGTAAMPTATQNYTYGADGQPRMMAGTAVNYADSHKMRDKGNLRYDWDTDTGPGRGRVVARHFNGASGPGSPGYKPGNGKGGGYGPCNNPGNAQTPLCDPNATQPGNGPAGDQAVRQDIAYNYMNRMERVDVRVDPHLTAIDPDYTVGYVYDSDGNRFQKRYADSNRSVTTHYPAPDYQIRYGGVDEAHTLIVRKADGLLATFSFPASYYLAGGASASQQGSQLAHLWDRLGEPGFDPVANAGDAFALLYGYVRSYDGWGGLLYRVLAVVSLLVVLVFLFTYWRRYDIYGNATDEGTDNRSFADINSISNTLFGFRDLPHRLTASTMILSLYAMVVASCSGGNAGSEIILPPGSGNFKNDVAAGLIGGHFFLTDPVGSVSLITDADGRPVTRYVYGPYGELNMALSNPDLDGDGMLFESIYKYNGQEFDYEIGLYNYKARMYDQKAGRFLTTDPVITENRGFDAYDPYGYVSGNPVNFTDPTGEVLCSTGIVYGHYTGPGKCGPGKPGNQELYFLLLAYKHGEDTNNQDWKNFALITYFSKFYPDRTNALSEVDEASVIHDRDGGGWTESDSFHANNVWIRSTTSMFIGGGLLGPIPTPRMWRKTMKRNVERIESQYALPHASVQLLAGIKTAFDVIGDWHATIAGTVLFGAANLINSVRGAVHKNKHTSKINSLAKKIGGDMSELMLRQLAGQDVVVDNYVKSIWADYTDWEVRQAVKRFGRNNPFKKKKSPVMFKL